MLFIQELIIQYTEAIFLKQDIGALYSLQRQELNNPVVMVLMIIWWQKKQSAKAKENENEITKQLRYFQLTCVRIRLFAVTSKSNFAFHFFFCIKFLVCLTFLSHDESSEKAIMNYTRKIAPTREVLCY